MASLRAKRAVLYFFHVHKAGGTTVCDLARRNRVPANLGHNCNFYGHPEYDDVQRFDAVAASTAHRVLVNLTFAQQLTAVEAAARRRESADRTSLATALAEGCLGTNASALTDTDAGAAAQAARYVAALAQLSPRCLSLLSSRGKARSAGLPAPARLGIVANEAWLPEGLTAGDGAVLITAVRSPRDRVVSEWLHERREGGKTTLGAWIRDDSRRASVSNAHVRRFCGGACMSPDAVMGEPQLQMALSRLIQFSVVLPLESLSTLGAELLRSVLGWTETDAARFGKRSSGGEATLETLKKEDPESWASLAEANALDERFVAEARRLFTCMLGAARAANATAIAADLRARNAVLNDTLLAEPTADAAQLAIVDRLAQQLGQGFGARGRHSVLRHGRVGSRASPAGAAGAKTRESGIRPGTGTRYIKRRAA